MSKVNTISLKSTTLSLLLILIIPGLLQSCVQGDRVQRVNPKKVTTLLEGGPHTGSWKTKDLSFQYQYHRDPNKFSISGNLVLSEQYTSDFNTLNNFALDIYLLDADLNVIKRTSLANVAFGTQEQEGSVKHAFEGPQEITGISFGYRGELRTSGGILDLYESPLS